MCGARARTTHTVLNLLILNAHYDKCCARVLRSCILYFLSIHIVWPWFSMRFWAVPVNPTCVSGNQTCVRWWRSNMRAKMCVFDSVSVCILRECVCFSGGLTILPGLQTQHTHSARLHMSPAFKYSAALSAFRWLAECLWMWEVRARSCISNASP